jgi:hypothetical protein
MWIRKFQRDRKKGVDLADADASPLQRRIHFPDPQSQKPETSYYDVAGASAISPCKEKS